MGFFGRHAPYYFWYFSALALLTAFFPLWIIDIGRTTPELVALQTIARICGVVAPLWLIYPITPMHPGRWLTATTAFCAIFACGMLDFDGDTSFLLMSLTCLGFFFLFSSLLPQVEALTLHGTQRALARYNYVRVAGSIGFALASWAAGILFGLTTTQAFPLALLGCILMALGTGVPMWRSDSHISPSSTKGLIRQALKHGGIRWVLPSALLLQAAFGCYYLFFGLHLRALNYSSSTIGFLMLVATGAEVLAFLNAHRFLKWRGPVFWIRAALALTIVRWVGIGWGADQLWLLILLQTTHAVGFALWHASSVRLIMDWRNLPGGAANGIAVFNSIGYGVGGVAGTLLAGIAWSLGAGAGVFALAGGLTAVALLLAARPLAEHIAQGVE